jgi:glutaredoxin 3
MNNIIIYTKQGCPYCAAAKALLNKKGASFTEHDLTTHPDLRPAMIEKAKGRTTVPQIFINGNHIGGSDDLHAIDAKAELDGLLKAAL